MKGNSNDKVLVFQEVMDFDLKNERLPHQANHLRRGLSCIGVVIVETDIQAELIK